MYLYRKFLLGFAICAIYSCNSLYQSQKVSYYDYRISNRDKLADTSLLQMVAGYGDSVNKIMNVVIAQASVTLEKKQPNGSLGLVLVDAIKEIASNKYGIAVDAAFINNGGIRIPSVPQGDITIGKVFEIMPFDNLIVVQKVDGKTLKAFLNLIAKKGGWPVSGISFVISNGIADNILINNQPINDETIYAIANSDYIANGGDDAEMLKKIPAMNKNVLMRDLFLDYFKAKTAKGEKITAPINNDRIKLL